MRTVLGRIWEDVRDFRVAVLLLLVYNVVARTVFHAFCPQLILTGFPCAGCGLTRAVFYILTGRIAKGMKLNPTAPLWILYLIWFFCNRYIRGTQRKSAVFWLGLVCGVTLAVYLYRMLHFFPGEPPLVYYRNNVWHRMVKIR